MSKIITPISFTKVPKLEFRQLVNRTIEVVAKYDPAALYVEGIYNLLLEAQPQLSKLQVVYRKHELTPDIQNLRVKRKDLFASIINMEKSMSKAKLSSMQEELLIVLPFVNKYFKNILGDKTWKANERIEQMFAMLESDSALKAAVTKVGLNVYLEELKTVDQKLQVSINNRISTSSKRPRMFTRTIKTTVSVAMTDLVNAIELAYKEHPEVDYMPVVNEINKLFKEFLVNIKSTATRNKNSVKTADEGQTTSAA
ncbi:MAG TPA: DUF6261 family protein [Paludibacter sp.]|nr:DUF6261 family protein [Paludibacter sp.]